MLNIKGTSSYVGADWQVQIYVLLNTLIICTKVNMDSTWFHPKLAQRLDLALKGRVANYVEFDWNDV